MTVIHKNSVPKITLHLLIFRCGLEKAVKSTSFVVLFVFLWLFMAFKSPKNCKHLVSKASCDVCISPKYFISLKQTGKNTKKTVTEVVKFLCGIYRWSFRLSSGISSRSFYWPRDSEGLISGHCSSVASFLVLFVIFDSYGVLPYLVLE